jgi:two-component system NtrC family sensor kinase
VHSASLLVINGPGRGNRFELLDATRLVIGRSVGCDIRLDDSQISRQHAAIECSSSGCVLTDLGSANGTRVNGNVIRECTLRHGDSVRVGSTMLAFQEQVVAAIPASPPNVQLIDDSAQSQHSAIVQSVEAAESGPMTLVRQKRGLELLYQVSEELVTPAHSIESLLQQILTLTLESVNADRGCILLRDPVGNDVTPIAVVQRSGGTATIAEDTRMPVSRTITDYVIRNEQAVRTSNAEQDDRFDGGNSIVTSGITEALCAPMRGRSELAGVFYLDTTTSLNELQSSPRSARLGDDDLRIVLAIARQTALALETRQFQDALLKAERFAAMGQTIAVLSHHIKNILQAVQGGSYLIQNGLNKNDTDLVRQGWSIVERNQSRIYELVMDMLSFSKERAPRPEPTALNEVVEDVMQLARSRAEAVNVQIEFRPGEEIPIASFDREGIHRAILNIVVNAIDAVENTDEGQVVLQTLFDAAADMVVVAVTDNGPGIPPEQRAAVFNVFESSKGSRGTGIGLPVSRKIIREHGGRVHIEGGPGEGSRFVLSWPRNATADRDAGRGQHDSAVAATNQLLSSPATIRTAPGSG